MNRRLSKHAYLLVFFGLSLFLALGQVYAQPENIQVGSKDQVDAVLVLDASGSMRVTDPERLRDEGAKLLLQFLKPGDRLGIVEFAKDAKVIRPLEKYEPVKAMKFAEDIEKVSTSGFYTNILAGLQAAQKMLKDNKRKNTRQTIILLSDGKFDPDPSQGEKKILTAGLVHTVLPELKQQGVVVHTLGFSKEADRELLEVIASSTDGANTYAESPQEIGDAFTKLFLMVKKPQIVSMSSKGFKIDGEVREATFYVNNEGAEEVTLRAPSGELFKHEATGKGMKWFRGKKFDVVTVEEPEVGSWQILGIPSNEGFATVLTKLKLLTDWPSNIIAGEERLLQVRLYEEDKPVVLPEMSEVTKYAFQVSPTDKVSEPLVRRVLQDNGEDGDKVARDGIFSSKVLLDQPGEYRLQILAKSPTFERNQTLPFRVKPRLVSLDVMHVQSQNNDIAAGGETGSEDYFRVKLSAEATSLKKIDVKLVAKDEGGRVFSLPLRHSESKSLRYEVPSAALPQDGEYELQATVTGENRKRKAVQGSSLVLKYTKVTSELDKQNHDVKVLLIDEEEEEDAAPDSPLIWIFIVLLVNLALGGFFFLKVKKTQGAQAFTVPVYEPSEELLAVIAELEEKAQQTEVDINNAIFQGKDPVAVPAGLGGGADPMPSDTAQSDGEEPAQDEDDIAEDEEDDADGEDDDLSSDEDEIDEIEAPPMEEEEEEEKLES